MARRVPDLRKLARRQRWMIWLVLIVIVAQFLPFVSALPLLAQFGIIILIIAAVIQIAFHILSVIGVVLLLSAQGNHPAIIVLTGLVMLAPCVNLLTLLLVNQSVTRTLKRAGLKVRLMGVDPAQLERVLNIDVCHSCGYNLTGNVTGICPECGEPIACRNCRYIVLDTTLANCPQCGAEVRRRAT